MAFSPEQNELLKAPLNMAHVKPAKSFGPKGDYIEGWHAMAEANRIFGFDGWSYEVPDVSCVFQGDRAIGKDKKPGFGVTYTAKVRLFIGDTVREDFGAGHGYDVDCGLAHESAIKEAVTDALKRALRSFGSQFGLALYDKTRANVTDEPIETPEDKKAAEKAEADKNALIDLLNAAILLQTTKADLDALYAKNKPEIKRLLTKEEEDTLVLTKFKARAEGIATAAQKVAA